MIRCLHCGAETNNGLALCHLCRRMASTILEFLPVYFRNLARWRPGRAGSRPVPGSRVLYDGEIRGVGTGDRISDTLDVTLGTFPDSEQAARIRAESEAANALTTWARVLVDDRPYLARLLDRLSAARQAETIDEAQTIAWLCAGFERYLTSISTTDWCGEFVRDLGHHEETLRKLTETAMPGWYAGACRKCKMSTYVVPGLTWVTCGACGTTTYARDHLEIVLNEARDWVARPKAMAEAIVALVDTEASVPKLYTRIRKWAHVGDIQPIRRTGRGYMWSAEEERIVIGPKEVGHARYRLGDVLDVLLSRDTRASTASAS